jgi:hypothetical protein
VAGKITDQQVQERLSRAGIEPEAQSRVLDLWDLEREGQTRDLTEAQMATALARRIVDLAEYQEWLRTHGYNDREVEILTELRTRPAE